ncbi:Uncharacterised protein [Vibrio cholerae]|nr:Uncharacterised protein [Vibrio cholerae]
MSYLVADSHLACRKFFESFPLLLFIKQRHF